MNKFDRVISTLILLQSKKVIKAMAVAERFDISLRTVYRDISTLKNAGIPIIGDPGIGYSLMSGYRLPPIMFTEEETAALLTAEKFIGKVTDKNTYTHYSNALVKIKAILRSSEKQSLAVLDDSIVISDNTSWENKPYLQDLFKSISAKNILIISYKKADGTSSERRVEPIGCYYHINNWYLLAYCQIKKDYRTFKMNRISELSVLEEHFETKHISLEKYMDQQNTDWKTKNQFYNIEIAFNKSLVHHAERRKHYFGFMEQVEIDEAVHMKFLNSSIEIIARWILQFGDQATVISPTELKTRMKTIATELYQHYQSK
ncbi:YafY family transcriptional regulator [Saprospiraceae bacterium]|nr:YafY family transcriptional regulator [Saprospiraceae bacterium]